MNLTIHMAALRLKGRGACGVIIEAQGRCDPLHEGAAPVHAPSLGGVEYHAILRALDRIVPLSPETVEFRCPSKRMIGQLTGAEPVPERLEELHQRVMAGLLKLDSWRLSVADPACSKRQRARTLARQAMDTPPTAEPAPPSGDTWSVTFDGDSSRCPARCPSDVEYTFGPGAPAGFCLHALPAVLTAPAESQPITCSYCGRSIHIER